MTFTSIASNTTQPTDRQIVAPNTVKLSKISVAASLLAIIGVTLLQNLLWMSASHPAELPTSHKQALAVGTKIAK
jgi:hypothetical protein